MPNATFKVGDKIRECDSLGSALSYVWEGEVVAVNTNRFDGSKSYDTHGTFVEWKDEGKDCPEECGGPVTLRTLCSRIELLVS